MNRYQLAMALIFLVTMKAVGVPWLWVTAPIWLPVLIALSIVAALILAGFAGVGVYLLCWAAAWVSSRVRA